MTETTTTTPVAATPAKGKPLVACWCGCGGTTKSRFVPGHDARFHGVAKKIARQERDAETELARLPHDEAREEMLRHADLELPKHEAREARKAELALEKARLKAAKTAPAAPVAETPTETPAVEAAPETQTVA